MANKSPTQRSLDYLRELGYTVAVVEHFNAFAGRRQDLFGCIDIVAVRGRSPGVLGVQTTTGDNLAARRRKALAIEELRVWLEAGGNRFHLHGWSKRGPRNKRKLWSCREVEVRLKDF